MTQVLIVEDGQEYSALFQRYLTEGFSFTRAGDGPEDVTASKPGRHLVLLG